MSGDPPRPAANEKPPSAADAGRGARRRIAALAAFAVALAVLYSRPIYHLALFALSHDLYSYIPLIPLISIYLVWTNKGALHLESRPSRKLAAIPLAAGILLLAAYWQARRAGWDLATGDRLAVSVVSLLSFLLAGCFFTLGTRTMRSIAFPFAFLIFMAPMPTGMHDAIERFLQVGSAYTAHFLFWISATPVLRIGTFFQLPGFQLEVAPECSGIHSTFMLFITSVLAAHLFLRTKLKRVVLVLAIIPLAFLRNGVRILTIGELCVHIGPQMIDSYIHRHGGPIFFALSLIPFFFLLLRLQKSEVLTARPS